MKKCPNRTKVFVTTSSGQRIPLNRAARREMFARMRKLVIKGETPEEAKMRVTRRRMWRLDRQRKLDNLCRA